MQAVPAYLQKFSSVDNILSGRLKQWAYTLAVSGMSVQVHHRDNVEFVRRILQTEGHGDVSVSFSPS